MTDRVLVDFPNYKVIEHQEGDRVWIEVNQLDNGDPNEPDRYIVEEYYDETCGVWYRRKLCDI